MLNLPFAIDFNETNAFSIGKVSRSIDYFDFFSVL